MSNDDLFVSRQCWLRYFFGTRTTAAKSTLLTVSASLIFLVVVGRGVAGAISTFVPIADEDPQQAQGVVVQPILLTHVQPQDVDLQKRILALSSATELEELPDGTLRRVPFAVFEARLRQGLIVGFALVESVSSSRITLPVNAAAVRKYTGLCFILTEERLATQVAPATG
ncbi:hypothetical protein C3747_98g109 [Trypanosoma cruzi]|uniref:Uncharacterized protein n=1 Tax=Trypanosoma cruzi TaxID=5693 RepID=A0A2V2WHF4_TRYCR|nr:hypothetical protein C3747_98g109 [Trypanosoma cruzi]RNC45250.1 polyribonucleotide 5'-hydroxyl-kinase [Trypanosoma cruzi]